MEQPFLHPAWHLVPMDQPGEQVSSTIELLARIVRQSVTQRQVWLRLWIWQDVPVLITSDN